MSLQVLENEIMCLLGQSGSGKTTVLKAIAGILPLENGVISLDEHVMSSTGNIVSPEKRGMGIIFKTMHCFLT